MKELENKLQEIINNYENGNKRDFRIAIKKLNAYEVATLISIWQPYHSAIAKIQIAYDYKD